jgi:predicted membrane channel-forming protein YqfA (hemolysin III family)
MKKALVRTICSSIYLRKLFAQSATWLKISGICLGLAGIIGFAKLIATFDTVALFLLCICAVVTLLTAGLVRYGEKIKKVEWDRDRKILFK